jgi:hypothetical protein
VSRSLRLFGYIAIGVLAGLLFAAGAIFMLTRTDWGMERARRFAVSWLAERVDGELRVGRISGPGLLGGLVIHDFGIIDPKGRPFLASDSIELAYNLRTLLRGEIILDRVVLYGPQVVLEKLPGDTAWNYQYVFPDRTPGDDTPRGRSLIMFNDALVVDGTATVRTPFEPAAVIEPRDTARILFDRLPGGLARVMRFENLNARLDRVIWESPIEEGRLIDVRSVETRGFFYRDPFQIRHARGTITVRDTIIAFDMPEVALPGSEAAVLGRVIMQQGRNDFDVRVEGSRFVFRDLMWLHPQLPEEGGGSLVLRIQTQPKGTLFLAEDARIAAPGTRLAGTFGVVAGDTLYFTQVDLRASPLDVQFIEQILPGGLPVDGLLVGTVEVRGPLSALETSGDLRLEGDVRGAGSEVAWRGVLDVRDGRIAARSFSADVRRLELALVSEFAPQLRIGGSVSGRVSGSGRASSLQFAALLEHASSDGGRSVFDAGGTLEGGGRSRRLGMTLTASPMTFDDLAQQIPALHGLQGELSGPVRIDGPLHDLDFRADLVTPGGPLAVHGRVWNDAGIRRVRADAEARGFLLHAFRGGLPYTVASGTLALDIAGDDLSTMTGPIRLVLDSTRFGELPHSTLLVDAALRDGMLVVDSAVLRGSLGTGRARGTLALVEGRNGRLDAGFSSESLTTLEPFIYRSGPAEDGEARVSGRVDAVATLSGWLRDLSLDAEANGDEILVGPLSARRFRADLEGRGIGTRASFILAGGADSLDVAGHRLATASMAALADGDSLAVSLTGSNGEVEVVALSGTLHRAAQPIDDFTDGIRGPVWAAAGPYAGHPPTPSALADFLSDNRNGVPVRSVRIDRMHIGSTSPWQLVGPAAFLLSGRAIALDSLVLLRRDGGRVAAAGRLAWAANETGTDPAAVGALPHERMPEPAPIHTATPVEFSVRAAGVPVSDLLTVIRSPAQGAGTLDGMLRLSGTPFDPLIDAELAGRDVVHGDVRLDHAFAELSYAAFAVDAHAEAQYGGRSILTGGGRIPLDLRLIAVPERRLDEPIHLALSADSLPPALALSLLDGFSNIAGRIDGTMIVAGTTIDPSLSGGFTIRNGAADWEVSGVRYSDVAGTFTLERDRHLSIEMRAAATDPRARGRSSAAGAGSGRITGTLDFAELTDPAFDLRFVADGAYAARRRDVEAQVSGELRLGGRYSRPEISGLLRIDEGALYIEELYRQFLIAGVELDDPSLLGLVDTTLVAVRPLIAASQNPFMKNLQVRDLQVNAGAGSWLRSRDMDVEVSGRLNVTFDRRDEDLRLTGSLTVERGSYTLYYPPLQSRRFLVRSGSIDFLGTPGIDPNLAITAAYKARTGQGEPLNILAVVSGTLQAPRVRLSSDVQPPISESDLASYLFFGVPTWQVANSGASQNRGVVAGLGVAALTPSVLGYASSGLQTLVQGAGILDYVGLTAAEGAGAEQTNAGFSNILAGTQLEIGRYIGQDLFVGASKRLGTSNMDIGARIEWRFLPEYSFELFAEDRLARSPGFGLRQESGLRRVFGLLLFREWGF